MMKISTLFKQILLELNKWLLLYPIFISISSCSLLSVNDNYIEYYPNGNIKIEAEMNDSSFHGVYKEFYKSGNLHYKFYFENNKPIGTQLNFFDMSNAIKVKTLECIIDNKNYRLMYSVYNESGKMIENLSYVQLSSDFDTLKLNEIKEIQLFRKYDFNKKFNNYQLLIGDFNRSFVLTDKNNYKSVRSKIPHFTIKFKALKKGNNAIRGYIRDYYIVSKKNGIITARERLPYYFEYNYYVK